MLYHFTPGLKACLNLNNIFYRTVSSAIQMSNKTALILGSFTDNDSFRLTQKAQKFDSTISSQITKILKNTGPIKLRKTKLFYGLSEDFPLIAVTGLGPFNASYNHVEMIDEANENVRIGIGSACAQLKDANVESVLVDSCQRPEASAEAAELAFFAFNELKTRGRDGNALAKTPQIKLLFENESDTNEIEAWKRGLIKAQSQNIARRLMELPANKLTPEQMTVEAKTLFEPLKSVRVEIRDKEWIKSMKMESFLSVSHGSVLPPYFIELHYNNAKSPDQKPIILVGKGITFDSGGISLKPSLDMDAMRADMGGAACVLSTVFGVAHLNLSVNLIGLMPMTENMPSGSATHPGDVVTARNGKTIQIDNTDAEGRLILADALTYASEFKPKVIVDLATLTGAMIVSLGSAATGVFSSSDEHFAHLQQAGTKTGDRVWRMPLFAHYLKSMSDCHLADLNNVGSHGMAGKSCTAAAFLKEFVDCDNWMHMDIAGVMMNKEETPTYMVKGMSGRPTRTMIEYVKLLSEIK